MTTGVALAIFVASLGLGLLGVVRQQRNDYEPDERPSDRELAVQLLRKNPIAIALLALYLVMFFVFDDAGVLAAVIVSTVLVVNGVVGARASLRRRGIERDHFLLATSIGFLVTTAMCGVWTMFESFADAPRLSMSVPWTVGLVAWIGTTIVLRRRAA